MLGVGVATLISNCCACAFFIVTILRQKTETVLRFRLPNGLPKSENVRSVFTVGIPSSIATLLFDIDYIVIDKLMSGYGDIALAAVGIVLKVERLPLNVGIGICQGMMPLVAYNYSSGDRKRMFRIIRFSLITGLIVGALSVTMYEILAGGIIRLFIADPETVRLGTDFLRIRCLATPLMFMSFFTVYTFQGFGRGERSLFLGFQHSDALYPQSFHWNVRHCVVAGDGGYPDSNAFGVCILPLQAETGNGGELR